MTGAHGNPQAPGEVLAIVPARGGSKSVPGKNLRRLLGKPLIAYSIECALESKRINRVIVSTDSEEIAEAGRLYGADVPFLRPSELAGDFSLDVEFHRHALEWLDENEGYQPNLVVNLRPTHPIRQAETIDHAIETFLNTPEADSLRSVRKSDFSPFKMWQIGDDGFAVPVAPLVGITEPYNMPRQLLPMVYWQDGYVDIARREVIIDQNSTAGLRILPFVIEEECIDIDYEDQIANAERLLFLASARPSGHSGHGRGNETRHPS